MAPKTVGNKQARRAPTAAVSRRWQPGLFLAGGLVSCLVALSLAWYLTLPRRHIDDLCDLFAYHPSWYYHSLSAQQRWGVPIPVQMAILRQESAFRSDAYPPRTRLLGVIPWERATSAYGYPQALDATWAQYQQATDNPAARRDDFAAAVDFVGWYTDQSQRRLGIQKQDAYHQYLAYHEGHRGFREQSQQQKPWLLGVARKVQGYAERYDRQLQTCPQDSAPPQVL